MSMTDPIGDLLTRIRNAQAAGKATVCAPASRLKSALLEVCKREGYIESYRLLPHNKQARRLENKPTLEITLKYAARVPAISEIRRVSKPGRRIYAKATAIPRFYNNLGIAILSTAQGMLSDAEARRKNVGGEVLCQIF